MFPFDTPFSVRMKMEHWEEKVLKKVYAKESESNKGEL